MKKIVVLGLAGLLLAFGLFACSNGGGNQAEESTPEEPSKEEIVAQAIEINDSDVTKQVLENAAKAKQDWDGKIVKYTGKCDEITTSSVRLYQETYNGLPLNPIYVGLSEDELASLERGKKYTVVGTMVVDDYGYQITDAFLVSE